MTAALLLMVGYPLLLLGVVELLLSLSRRAYDPRTWGDGGASLSSLNTAEARRPPWPQSEIGGFYAGLGLILALLSAFISVVAMARASAFTVMPLHGAVLVAAAIAGARSRRLLRRFAED